MSLDLNTMDGLIQNYLSILQPRSLDNYGMSVRINRLCNVKLYSRFENYKGSNYSRFIKHKQNYAVG